MNRPPYLTDILVLLAVAPASISSYYPISFSFFLLGYAASHLDSINFLKCIFLWALALNIRGSLIYTIDMALIYRKAYIDMAINNSGVVIKQIDLKLALDDLGIPYETANFADRLESKSSLYNLKRETKDRTKIFIIDDTKAKYHVGQHTHYDSLVSSSLIFIPWTKLSSVKGLSKFAILHEIGHSSLLTNIVYNSIVVYSPTYIFILGFTIFLSSNNGLPIATAIIALTAQTILFTIFYLINTRLKRELIADTFAVANCDCETINCVRRMLNNKNFFLRDKRLNDKDNEYRKNSLVRLIEIKRKYPNELKKIFNIFQSETLLPIWGHIALTPLIFSAAAIFFQCGYLSNEISWKAIGITYLFTFILTSFSSFLADIFKIKLLAATDGQVLADN